jgi:hypothetical protein
MHKRIGFLFFAYKREFWWFESLTLFYKLAMTVLIIFVSNGDENKVLFGMLLATTMMATLAFFQPFKHSDILSINTGGQMAVLLVLFAAMFLLINDGGGGGIAFLLVFCTLMPIAAGVSLTLRLPPEARAPDSGDALGHTLNKKVLGRGSPSLSKQLGRSRKGAKSRKRRHRVTLEISALSVSVHQYFPKLGTLWPISLRKSARTALRAVLRTPCMHPSSSKRRGKKARVRQIGRAECLAPYQRESLRESRLQSCQRFRRVRVSSAANCPTWANSAA